MFSKVLIANRGEIAVRVARTCHDLGIAVVAVYSDVDSNARHVALADEAVALPGVAPRETYLNADAIIAATVDSGAEAIHPGYGFLSERAEFAEAVEQAGLAWIGPPPAASRATGDKVRARQLAERAGVSVVPGTLEPIRDTGEVYAFGERHGYPIAIKAAGGGGGRGLKVASAPDDVDDALESAQREASTYFGYGDVYLERYLADPKHVEVQIVAPAPGQAMWLGARDCSMQRRHQKLIEETPPPTLPDIVPAMGDAAVAVANACGYANAGTVEFLVDDDGAFYFLEVNARLQVEHTITEQVLGVDLVAAQLRVAAREDVGFVQQDVLSGGSLAPRGHAIECRINAEDPARGFLPGPGRLTRYREPGGPGIRVDSGYGEGDEVPGAYDSLIAKVVAWAPTRAEARARMLRALGEFHVDGVPTTIAAHRVLLEHPSFVDGTYSTRTVEQVALDDLPSSRKPNGTHPEVPTLMVGGSHAHLWNPAIARSISTAAAATGRVPADGAVVAPMHGTIVDLLVSEGDEVAAGDAVAVLEAMKMESHVVATARGIVREVRVRRGAVVEAGDVVAVVG